MKSEDIDTVVYFDSDVYPEGQYMAGNCLYLCGANGATDIVIHDVGLDEYLKLYDDPSQDSLREFLSRHRQRQSPSASRKHQGGKTCL